MSAITFRLLLLLLLLFAKLNFIRHERMDFLHVCIIYVCTHTYLRTRVIRKQRNDEQNNNEKNCSKAILFCRSSKGYVVCIVQITIKGRINRNNKKIKWKKNSKHRRHENIATASSSSSVVGVVAVAKADIVIRLCATELYPPASLLFASAIINSTQLIAIKLREQQL